MELKVGQSCKVVEILKEGGYTDDSFKVRGFTVGEKEIKVWGKLTITKVK